MSILKLTADTLVGTPVAGNLEYDGDMYFTDSAANRGQIQRISRATAVTASGTAIDFTGIPAWVTKITVMFSGVSTSGASFKLIQLGSGTFTTTGYLGGASVANGTGTSNTVITNGFGIINASAADIIQGSVVLTNLSGNVWTGAGVLSGSNAAYTMFTAGSITLAGTLDRIRITTVNGTDTFDAGTINIMYEG